MPLNYSKGLSRARSTISPSIYSKKVNSVEITDFSGGLNTKDEDISINDNQLSYGQNLTITSKGKLEKALGMTLYGNFLGTTTGILWGGNFVNRAGTQEQLVAYDTGLYRYVASVWTALTGVTLTTNKDGDGAYFPLTNKFYYINQTDNVVKYTSGTSADQTDANFKKGKFVEHFQNRLLVANVSSQEDYVWYTDLGVDTFSANNYFRVEGTITGLKTFYDKVLIFTKRKIHRLQNFIFDGNIAGPEAVFTLPTEFGTIYDRTIVVADNLVYFVGQDLKNKCHIYVTDGFNVSVI
ncbi:hypothetical protein M1146_07770, partial [Patescibacteria group bacterium]|nr:hypothetical protein [Patescibacteria group bacterium]